MTRRKKSNATPGGEEKSPPVQPQGPPEARFSDAFSEDVHVNEIHRRIVAREQEEPEEGFEPTPSWVWVVSVLLLFAMGFYLGRYGGDFNTIAHLVEEPSIIAAGEIRTEVRGDIVFAAVCQACHQADGKGVEGKYPPLAGSEWLDGDPFTPARIVLFGLEGEIRVRGKKFNNKMPQFHDKLSNEEIAAAISYARSSFGNKAAGVSPADVDSMRRAYQGRGPWNAEELELLRNPGKIQ